MGLAVVIGGANCVWQDVLALYAIATPDIVITVNDATAYYPGHVDAIATLHPRYLDDKHWISSRIERGYNKPERIFSQSRKNHVTDVIADYNWPEMTFTGSSGLFGVRVALEYYNCSVVCCGVPMTKENNHFFDNNKWGDAVLFADQWDKVLHRLAGRVKSMSGYTADLLGKPTKDWCNAAHY